MRSRSLSISAALGGRSAASLRSWLVMLGPSILLILFLEHSILPWWIALASAVVQHLAVGALLVPLSAMRSRLPIIPLSFMFVVWALVGVVRAIVGGGIVLLVTGEDPHFVYRLLFWSAISIVWTPLFIYAEAQRSHRYWLLDSWSDATDQLAIESARSQQSSAELRARLVAAVQESVLPVIHEIQRSLSELRATGDALESVGDRIGSVTRDAARIIDTDSPEPVPQPPRVPNNRAILVTAGDYHRSRPLHVSGLAALLLSTVLVPVALLEVGEHAAVSLLPVLAITVVTLLAGLLLSSVLASTSVLPVYGAFTVAGLVGVGVILLTAEYPLHPDTLALAVFYCPAVVLTAALLSAAIGLGSGNEDLAEGLEELELQVNGLRGASVAAETRVRDQVSTLMHGPVLGRLSACVMALNFHASSSAASDPERAAIVTRNVLDHLALAASDLEALS